MLGSQEVAREPSAEDPHKASEKSPERPAMSRMEVMKRHPKRPAETEIPFHQSKHVSK